ncbi:MAG: RagB/SusD family nutrient uptake outer membrane protein [Flavisolibacter sp.]
MKHIHEYFVNLFCFCILLICSFFFPSCKKFLAIAPPQTQLQSVQVFNNSQTAIAAVAGLYSQMMQTSLAMTNGGATLYPALSAAELYNTASNADYDQFRNSNISPASSTGLNRLWTFAYRNIYQANAIIEGLQNSADLSDSLKSQLHGEMLVVKALHYFYLVNLFGPVPLVTTTSFDANKILPNAPVVSVYDSIEADLIQAKEELPVSYPSAGRLRPNKWTAAALLARVYLYRQNWLAAETQASEVIGSGTYTILPSLNDVFLTTSNEAIWQLSPVSPTINTAEGNLFNPLSATARPPFAATDALLNAFETGDQRKTNWLKSTVSGGKTYYYPYKYKVRTAAPPYTEYYMVLRLSELYLVRAGARAQQNKLIEALGDLNTVRTRAGLPASSDSTRAGLLTAIDHERRIEFMFEWGHRWLDLKRTGQVNTFMASINPSSWQPEDALYPIPQYELDTNPFLTQNPGY